MIIFSPRNILSRLLRQMPFKWFLNMGWSLLLNSKSDNLNFNPFQNKIAKASATLGRSMVEMLGVLAIIGVLSVGAITGYQKAMFKYKLNKQAEQISTLVRNALIYAGEFKQNGYDSITKYLIKLDAVPKEMIQTPITDYTPLYDAMGFKVGIYFSPSPPSYFYAIYIFMDDTKYSKESCRNIVSSIQAYSGEIWQISFNNGSTIDGRTFGDKYCNKLNQCIKDMSIYEIDNFCGECRQKTCSLSIFYGYYKGA